MTINIVPLKLDVYRVALNCYQSAMAVRQELLSGRAIAFPLKVGGGTMYHISFVPLNYSVPFLVRYDDGSGKGVQINIDRKMSYALPWGSAVNEPYYLAEKWNVGLYEAQALLPFFNTILTGNNYFRKGGDKHKKTKGTISPDVPGDL